ncbi:MAG: NAD(P)/FAD-dependent oxidoreductase [Armatimonadota bacterium]
MTVGIIGGGISGLTTAYYLSQSGHEVTVFEREEELGGLAGSFDFEGLRIERYYHFICGGDHALLDLCREVGLGDEVRWHAGGMNHFYRGRLHRMSTPLDLLRFSPLSLRDRVRFGLHASRASRLRHWDHLDGLTAKEWLLREVGPRAYDVIWHPLLAMKFGEYYDRISAAWLWHRIHRVATSRRSLLGKERHGCIEGGTERLIERLRDSIAANGGAVLPDSPVGAVRSARDGRLELIGEPEGRTHSFDAVVSAVPLPVLAGLLPEEAAELRDSIAAIPFIGVVCMILSLRRRITDSFWVNVNDERIPFNGLIEYTNLNLSQRFAGNSIVYIPFYTATSAERYHAPDERLFQEYAEALALIQPRFSADDVEAWRIFRDPYAQPICPVGFSGRIPPIESSLPGLYVLDSAQLYPADRNLSGMIALARRAVELICGRRVKPPLDRRQ